MAAKNPKRDDGGQSRQKRRLQWYITVLVGALIIGLGVLIAGPWVVNLVDSYEGVVLSRNTETQSIPGRRGGSRVKPVFRISVGTSEKTIDREIDADAWRQFARGDGVRKSFLGTSPVKVTDVVGLDKLRERYGTSKAESPAE
ncbi:MAG: hypothetical protein HYY84_14945 [Deltaproteobacteria bacterium]|nr:hypothetical protein [Deltaproteobacteria bacterium]